MCALVCRRRFLFAVAGLAGVAALAGLTPRGPRAQGPLRHEAYVWQREWTPAVRAAVRDCAPLLSGYVALGAEVAWRGGRIEVARVARDPAIPAGAGVALRIGPYPGPFAAGDAVARHIADLAGSLAAEWRPRELQVDFDCAESKLDGYRLWVEAVRRRVAPVPVVVTALPCWLDRSLHRRGGRAHLRHPREHEDVLRVVLFGMHPARDLGSLLRTAYVMYVAQAC